MRIVPIEADLAGLLLQLECSGQGREVRRDAAKRHTLRRGVRPARGAFGLLLGLDALPQRVDLLGAQRTRVAEYVGMSPDQLLGNGLDDPAEVEQSLLLGHSRVKHDLQKEVPEFVAEIIKVAAFDRVSDLVGFLDGVRRDGREVLFQVPGTSGAQACAAPP